MDEADRRFLDAAETFRTWAERYDPERTTAADVRAAFGALADRAPAPVLARTERPGYRVFRPNAEWQAMQRKAARLPFNGYRSARLANDDETPDTQCALSYDVADLHEIMTAVPDEQPDLEKYFRYLSWGYVNLRIHAAIGALDGAGWIADPFGLRVIKGRSLRFVSWRTSAWTHASEDAPDVRGAGTLCGGTLAFHKHTQQQWSCHPCSQCRNIVDGLPARYGQWPLVQLVVRDADGPAPE